MVNVTTSRALILLSSLLCGHASAISETALLELLEPARKQMKMPGLRAAVRMPDGEVVVAATGLADVEAGRPLTNTIGIPGGSTGKTFAAALTMLLVEDGVLSLDDPASRWLGQHKWFRRLPNAESMRVRHLLSHSAGLRDYVDTGRFHTSMVWRVLRHGSARYEPEELIRFVHGRKPLFPAGKGYNYTDAGYLVLGRLIEAASGRAYYDLLTERILRPQRLLRVRPAAQSVLTDISTGYMGGGRNLKKDGRMKFDPSSEWTGGGLITTPEMLVRFFGALAEGEIVKPQTFTAMLEDGWQDPDQPEWHYGFGLFVNHRKNLIFHGGLWPGYRSRVAYYRSSGVAIAVQTNRDGKLDLAGLLDQIHTRAMAVMPAQSPASPVTEGVYLLAAPISSG